MTGARKTAALALALAVCLAGCRTGGGQAVKTEFRVRVVRAEAGEAVLHVDAPATLFARQESVVAARLTAPVVELLARKGDRVAAGQVLARLESRDLEAQRNEARAAVGDAEATLEKLESGTLPGDVERARGQLASAQAALEQAEKFLERRKRLYGQGAIPHRDLLVTQTEFEQARAAWQVAQNAYELLLRQTGQRDIAIARSRLDAARARLGLAEAQLSYATVRSPFAGTVTEQFVFTGDMAGPGSPLFRIADLAVAVARAQVPETEAVAVKRGQPCSFEPADFPGMVWKGAITVVNDAVDPARRTVEAWCEITAPDNPARTGLFGAVRIETGRLSQTTFVPAAAVQWDEDRRHGFVMAVVDGRRASRRPVETASPEEGRVAVLKGLAPGTAVIVEGAYGLPDGAGVTVVEGRK